MKYKAISIQQPWAWAIANGFKTIETRTWPTGYRGELLIVSSLKPDVAMLKWFLEQPGISVKVENKMEYGKAIAVAELVDCRGMTEEDQDAALCDIYPGAFSWVLENVREIEPFAVKGQLGLYEVDYEEPMVDHKLDDIWEHLEGQENLGDACSVNRGVLEDKQRPFGVCWPCKKLAEEAMIHESPGTAECCIGCDAYEGTVGEHDK